MTELYRAILRLQFEYMASMRPELPVCGNPLVDFNRYSPTIPKGDSKEDGISRSTTFRQVKLPDNKILTLKPERVAATTFDTPLLGSIIILKRSSRRQREMKSMPQPGNHQSQLIARYLAPSWLSYRAWELCCTLNTFNIATYNIIPSTSRQLRYAKAGSLSEL